MGDRESNSLLVALGVTGFVTAAGFAFWLYGPPSPYFGWDKLIKQGDQPSTKERLRLRLTAFHVSPLYKRVGPFVVTSGYRSFDAGYTEANPSPHKGWAIDIVPTTMSTRQWFDKFVSLVKGGYAAPFQVIDERDHVHIDYRLGKASTGAWIEPTEGTYSRLTVLG